MCSTKKKAKKGGQRERGGGDGAGREGGRREREDTGVRREGRALEEQAGVKSPRALEPWDRN